jgi:hypothetical protein
MVELKILELYRNCKRKKADNVTAWLVHVVSTIKEEGLLDILTNLDLYCARLFRLFSYE